MARKAEKIPDEYLALKVKTKTLLSLAKGFLILVGKPLYYLVSYSLLVSLFLTYLVGHSTRILLTFRIPKLKLPRLRFALPPLPKISKLPRFRLNKGLVFLLSFFSLLLFFFWYTILRDLPSPKELTNRKIEVSTKIYDRNGVLLYKIYKNENRTLVPLEKIPPQVILATLAAEDAEFYSHPGISLRGILRAIFKNIKKGELSGGSTITQQLVKNALLSPEKTLTRKIREVILAIGVELAYSKDAILEMYFNEVSYGGTAYGVQEAANLYFAKDVKALTLAEAAFLAGLPKSPSKYSPFGANLDLALARQKEVLRLMRTNGYLTDVEENEAAKENLTFAVNRTKINAPHFVMFVKDQLVERYGEELVEKGGLEVVTTLDYSIQKMAEGVVRSEVEKLKPLRVGNGAALVFEPKTGEILAMVGSKDYFDLQNDGNVNVTVRPRQPGSSIKVVNYSYALSHGYTPATILQDSPVTFSVAGQPPYSPRNYDGNFRGAIFLRSALGQSRNIPAVKVLASYGVAKMIELGGKMGITTWEDPSRFGLSLTLGGGEVKLIDLARVYATIANYGRRPEIASILKVTNYKGEILQENGCVECPGEPIIDPRVAFLLISILSDNAARAPEFGYNSSLVIPGHPEVAVKTGTSNDLKDNLTVGFNQKYLVAVWVGNNDSSPMSKIASGITGAAPIWNQIMRRLLAEEPNHNWEAPPSLVQVAICSWTGSLPCEGCPTRAEWFLEENRPQKACGSEQIAKIKEEAAEKNGQILEPAARFP